jgi:hypothetical protein
MVSQNLASFEGRYPKDLFNKSVYTDDNQVLVGYVAKEIGNIIVVFSEFNKKIRYDIPKSDIVVAGSMVIVQNSQFELSKYKVKRDAPFPEGKDLKPIEKNTHSMEVTKVEKASMEQEKIAKAQDLKPDKKTDTELIATSLSQTAEPPKPLPVNSSAADRKIPPSAEKGHGSPIKFIQTSPISRQAPTISSQGPLNQKHEYTGTATKPVTGTGIFALNHEIEKHMDTVGAGDVTDTTAPDSTKEASSITDDVTGTGTNPTTSDQQIDENLISDQLLNKVQQSAIEVEKGQEIQQINSQVEYNADAKLSDKIETASTTVYESTPSEALNIIEDNRDSVSIIPDKPNMGFNEVSNDLQPNYYGNPFISMSTWQLSWIELYNEFTRIFANLSLNWFDLYCKFWLPRGEAEKSS